MMGPEIHVELANELIDKPSLELFTNRLISNIIQVLWVF